MAFAYECGWVAFLDLLGTTAGLTAQSAHEYLERYQQFMSAVVVTGSAYRVRGFPEILMTEREWNERFEQPHSKHMVSRVFSMSDSVVVAVPDRRASSNDTVAELIEQVGDMVSQAWTLSLGIRGAIAFGDFVVDWDNRLIQGPALAAAAKWEGAQAWAWLSFDPSSARATSLSHRGYPFIEVTVPSKLGPQETVTIDPAAMSLTFFKGPASGFADLTYGSWKCTSDPAIREKCRNTLQWLDSRDIGPGGLSKPDAQTLSIECIEEPIKIRISGDDVGSVLDASEAASRCLPEASGAVSNGGLTVVLTTVYRGSPHRLLQELWRLRASFRPEGGDSIAYSLSRGEDHVGDILPGFRVGQSAADQLINAALTGTLAAASPYALNALLRDSLRDGDVHTGRALYDLMERRLPAAAREALQGLVSECLQDRSKVIESGREVRRRVPGWWLSGEYWYNRSVSFCVLFGDVQEMLRSAVIAAALEPSNADAWDQVGEALQQIGRPGRALAWHRQAVDMDPANAKYVLHAGQALTHCGKYEQAIKVLEFAADLRPGYWQAHLKLCWVDILRGDLVSAAARLESARRCNAPTESMALLGCSLLLRRGEYGAIIASIDRDWDGVEKEQLKQELCCFEMHALIATGEGASAIEVIQRRGVEMTARHKLLIAQALLECEDCSGAIKLVMDASHPTVDADELNLVLELAELIASPHNYPLADSPAGARRPSSVTLCATTIERAARFGIPAAFAEA